jgi:Concanavalin A-like lectin/glucanases superfamily
VASPRFTIPALWSVRAPFCLLALAFGLTALGGCAESVDRVFHCSRNDQCGDGTCEGTGYCSFAADSCPTRRRYGALAPAPLSGQCVQSAYRDLVMSDHPLAYWRLGERPGTITAADETGAAPGMFTAGVTLAQPGALAGDADTSAEFDGTTGYVLAPAGPDVSSGEVTFEAWIFPTGYGPGATWRAITGSDANRAYSIGDDGTGLHGVLINYSPSPASAIRPQLGVWSHVVVEIVPGTSITFYIDGSFASQSTWGATPAAGGLADLIGRQQLLDGAQGGFFLGRLDEVAIYGYLLGPDRVTAHYRGGVAP